MRFNVSCQPPHGQWVLFRPLHGIPPLSSSTPAFNCRLRGNYDQRANEICNTLSYSKEAVPRSMYQIPLGHMDALGGVGSGLGNMVWYLLARDEIVLPYLPDTICELLVHGESYARRLLHTPRSAHFRLSVVLGVRRERTEQL
jgi:hypothetical protein